MKRRALQTPFLIGTLAALLCSRHAMVFFNYGDFAHFTAVENAVEELLAGRWLIPGPDIGGLRLTTTALFYWLHLPAIVFEDAVLGLQGYYLALEGLALLAWLVWGRRAGLDRRLLWTSAFFLAAFAEPKVMVCHNMTPASWLVLPLYISVWSAFRDGRLRAMVVPGLLLTIAAQMHMFSAVLLAPLAITSLLVPGARVRRIAVLGGTFTLATVLCFVAGVPELEKGLIALAESPVVPTALIDREEFLRCLGMLATDPFAVTGVVLAGVLLIRPRRERPPGQCCDRVGLVLALCWFVGGALLLAAILSHRVQYGAIQPRLALLGPARAVLSATLVLVLVDAVIRLVGRRTSRDLYWEAAVLPGLGVIGALLAAGWIAVAANSSVELGHDLHTEQRGRIGLFWDAVEWGCSAKRHRYLQALRRAEDEVGGDATLLFTGPNWHEMAAHVRWRSRARGDPQSPLPESLADIDEGNALVLPEVPGLDASGVPGWVGNPWFQIVPGACPVRSRERPDWPGALAFDPPGPHARYLLLYAEVSECRSGTLRPWLDVADRRVSPAVALEAYERDGERHLGWWVFELPGSDVPLVAHVAVCENGEIDGLAVVLSEGVRISP